MARPQSHSAASKALHPRVTCDRFCARLLPVCYLGLPGPDFTPRCELWHDASRRSRQFIIALLEMAPGHPLGEASIGGAHNCPILGFRGPRFVPADDQARSRSRSLVVLTIRSTGAVGTTPAGVPVKRGSHSKVPPRSIITIDPRVARWGHRGRAPVRQGNFKVPGPHWLPWIGIFPLARTGGLWEVLAVTGETTSASCRF